MSEKPLAYAQLPAHARWPRSGWNGLFLGSVVWFLPAIFLIVVVSVCSGLILTPAVFVGGPIGAYLLAFSVNRYLRARNRRRIMIVLGYLENAMRLNLPLDRFLQAAEMSERSGLQRWLRRLRHQLAQGFPVDQSLQLAIPEFPDSIAVELKAAEQQGTLRTTLTRIIDDDLRSRSDPDESHSLYRLYPFIVGICVMLLMSFLLFIILPKFREIFADFKADLPWSTQFLFSLFNYPDVDFSTIGPIVWLLALTMILLICTQLQQIFTPNWPLPRPGRIFDWLAWHIPLWRQAQRNKALAAVCNVLSTSTHSGMPLPRALALATALPMNVYFRRALDHWHAAMIGGDSPDRAAAAAGLPAMVVGFLTPVQIQPATEDQSYSDIFQFLARYYRARFSASIVMLRAAYEPFMILVLGSAVGFIVYALFSALVHLIDVTGAGPPGGAL